MKIREWAKERREMFFFMALFVYVIWGIIPFLSFSNLDLQNNIRIILRNICFLFVAICLIILCLYDVKQGLESVLITILMIGVFIGCGKKPMLFDLTFVMLSWNIDLKKILKVILGSRIFILLSYFILSLCGQLLFEVYIQSGRKRRKLGFESPNFVGYFLLTSFLLVWFLYLSDKFVITICISFLCTLFCALCINSWTNAILFAFFPIVILLWNGMERINLSKYWLFSLLPCFFVLVSLMLMFFFEKNPQIVNSLIWGNFYQRFHCAFNNYRDYGFFHLLGLKDNVNIDGTYLCFPQKYGILGTATMVLVFIKWLKRAIREKQRSILFVFSIVSVAVAMTSCMTFLAFNWSLLATFASHVNQTEEATNVICD